MEVFSWARELFKKGPPPKDEFDEYFNKPPKPDTDISYVFSLDLGQSSDYSAGVAIQVNKARDDGKKTYVIRFIKRWPLLTPYPRIVEDVVGYCEKLDRPTLAIDGTGVGQAVTDLFRQAKPSVKAFRPVKITAGSQVSSANGYLNVPKVDLVAVLVNLFQSKRLAIVPTLPMAKTLIKELQNFKVKVNLATGHESFEAWREKDKDDLVLAAAIGLFIPERFSRQFEWQ